VGSSLRLLGAAITLLLSVVQLQAAGAPTCGAYAREAAAKAQGVRAFNCGYTLNDPRWSTDRNKHQRWCSKAPRESVLSESVLRRAQIETCQMCRSYANLAVAAAIDNGKMKCGFTGPRWSELAPAHFGWCMQLRESAGETISAEEASFKAIREKMEKSMRPETSDRVLGIEECKLRQTAPGKTRQKS
jgi:hypothetical protein